MHSHAVLLRLPAPLWLFCLSLGIAVVQWWPSLPSIIWLGAGWGLCLFACLLLQTRSCRLRAAGKRGDGKYVRRRLLRFVLDSIVAEWLPVFSLLVLCLLSGALYSAWRAQLRLADILDRQWENRAVTIRVKVTGLPRDLVNGWAFESHILPDKYISGLPSRVLLRWFTGTRGGPYTKPQRPLDGLPDVRPGQVWQMTIKLKRHRTPRNFHGFDYDAYLFASGIRASGSVSGAPRLLWDEPWRQWGTAIERLRFDLRRTLNQVLHGKRYGPVMIALVMGDQNGINQDDWKIFNLTGITHLVSISGSHITMLAALGSLGVFRLWRRLRLQGKWLAERKPAHIAAAASGLVVAGTYSLLAGWGIPAQRTFVMLAILWISVTFRIQTKGMTLLMLAGLLILVIDPWAVLSIGFCLSFAAIAGLMLWGVRGEQCLSVSTAWWQRLAQSVARAATLQLFMSVALLPLLVGLFHQYAFVSPIVNAFAIPIIGGLVTPLALLLAVLCASGVWPQASLWLAGFTHRLLQGVIDAADVLARQDWAAAVFPAPPTHWVVAGMMGLVIFALPKGFPVRVFGLMLLIPVLVYRAPRPLPGDWFMTALDVGQGAAVLVQTRHHTVLFDTGVRHSHDNDSGSRVVVPYLQALGISVIDELIISHSDLDHAGGAGSVLQQVQVRHAYTPFALNFYLEKEQQALQRDLQIKDPQAMFDLCQRGVAFAYDGVRFEFIHPWPVQGLPAKADNDHSCVLRIDGRYHSALLTGDIGASVEKELVTARPGLLAVDVVMMPHHGSASSSSRMLVEAAQPLVAFAQAGYLNRYGHPAATVMARWRDTSRLAMDTIQTGAIQLRSTAEGLWVNSARAATRRYWDGF
ncbi:competence protein [Advenella kashmirensis W13003]|uniref:Competence protein n=1 Tax=Advenella kashmirensis W13003 TaxID=1424334 RepID=V8QRA5_9BURK|nr:DNA internalization-related competence protein ComEC/Rec2 [Advenella kashmirensis]ETF01873.1 competence protein [Advenella kashmirensis W13003]